MFGGHNAGVRRRQAAWLLTVLGVLTVLAVPQALAVAFLHPPEAPLPVPADAIVVLSGDLGDRLERAVALAKAGVAPTLVILRPSDGPAVGSSLCGRRVGGATVRCVDPELVSTRGDGREIARLAAAGHWSNVVVVTSRFHGLRARIVVDRCTPARVTMATSRPSLPWRGWLRAMAHEIGGLVEVGLLRRVC